MSPATAEHDELPLNTPFILLQGQPGGTQPGNGTGVVLGTSMHNSFSLNSRYWLWYNIGPAKTWWTPWAAGLVTMCCFCNQVGMPWVPNYDACRVEVCVLLQPSLVSCLQARLTPATGTGPLLP